MAKNHVATYQIRDMVRFIMYENKDDCNLLKKRSVLWRMSR